MPVTPVICALCLPSFCASVLACTFSPSDWPVSCASPSPSQACLDLASRLSLSHPSLPHQGLSSRSTLFFSGGLLWRGSFPNSLPFPLGLPERPSFLFSTKTLAETIALLQRTQGEDKRIPG
ncbi:hypothetical protein CCHR01_13017 [Colletotrichum chrysophilum]|uniref:Secreted protein n=1 Tax=Colletotrichum chrysophilum TaxID=1836956 RepID=A0AAD9AA74_9PEZI|nr:hypothetical protein CCHR01_13017 [Colletotrichum chrysophilum]